MSSIGSLSTGPESTLHDSAPSPNLEPLNGVTTGSYEVSEKQIRSWVDRLGKAARKANQEDTASAWLMVGRIQAELQALIDSKGLEE